MIWAFSSLIALMVFLLCRFDLWFICIKRIFTFLIWSFSLMNFVFNHVSCYAMYLSDFLIQFFISKMLWIEEWESWFRSEQLGLGNFLCGLWSWNEVRGDLCLTGIFVEDFFFFLLLAQKKYIHTHEFESIHSFLPRPLF